MWQDRSVTEKTLQRALQWASRFLSALSEIAFLLTTLQRFERIRWVCGGEACLAESANLHHQPVFLRQNLGSFGPEINNSYSQHVTGLCYRKSLSSASSSPFVIAAVLPHRIKHLSHRRPGQFPGALQECTKSRKGWVQTRTSKFFVCETISWEDGIRRSNQSKLRERVLCKHQLNNTVAEQPSKVSLVIQRLFNI